MQILDPKFIIPVFAFILAPNAVLLSRDTMLKTVWYNYFKIFFDR